MTDLDRGLTHSEECWSFGRRHYECAMREIERLRSWGVPDGHRMCVNCGRDLKLTDKRGEDWCRDKYPGQDFYACTGDMTYKELIAKIHRLENNVRAHPAAVEKAREEEREVIRKAMLAKQEWFLQSAFEYEAEHPQGAYDCREIAAAFEEFAETIRARGETP